MLSPIVRMLGPVEESAPGAEHGSPPAAPADTGATSRSTARTAAMGDVFVRRGSVRVRRPDVMGGCSAIEGARGSSIGAATGCAPWSIWEERAPRFGPIVNPACLPAAAWQPLPHGGLPPLPPVLDSSSRPYRLGPRGGRAPLLPQPVEGGGAGPAPPTRRGDGVSRRRAHRGRGCWRLHQVWAWFWGL
jgi:hypothetical protein